MSSISILHYLPFRGSQILCQLHILDTTTALILLAECKVAYSKGLSDQAYNKVFLIDLGNTAC